MNISLSVANTKYSPILKLQNKVVSSYIKSDNSFQLPNYTFVDKSIITFRALSRSINLSPQGDLNERIAGYEAEKDYLRGNFINAFLSKFRLNDRVPSGFLLYGPTKVGKNTIFNAIADELKEIADVVCFPDAEQEKFIPELNKQLNNARERYLNYKKRTIILIKEPEKFLSMSPEDADALLEYKLGKEDTLLLKKYGNNSLNINMVKSLLDHCSEVPDNKDDLSRYATTLFFTTKNPHLIHPDLISREGKISCLGIKPAENNNIESIFRQYIEKSTDYIENIKKISKKNEIDSIKGISITTKNKLKELKALGKLDTLEIDYKKIPYDKIVKLTNPTINDGAYSNDMYRLISEKALTDYLKTPEIDYGIHLAFVLAGSKKDISSRQFNKFTKIHNLMSPRNLNEGEKLRKLEQMGCLDEKNTKRLENIRLKEKQEKKQLEILEYNGQITKKGKKQLEKLRQIENDEYSAREEF
jgi:hypothetical protein